MADIFGRTITLGPVLSGHLLRVTFGDNQGGMIPQSVTMAQERGVQVQMDIGTGKLVQTIGIPNPVVVSIAGVVTDVNTFKSFIDTYGTGCGATPDLVITATMPLCTSPVALVHTIKYPKMVRFQNSISVENYVYVGSIALVGVSLEIS